MMAKLAKLPIRIIMDDPQDPDDEYRSVAVAE
jgi:hypothetical protein